MDDAAVLAIPIIINSESLPSHCVRDKISGDIIIPHEKRNDLNMEKFAHNESDQLSGGSLTNRNNRSLSAKNIIRMMMSTRCFYCRRSRIIKLMSLTECEKFNEYKHNRHVQTESCPSNSTFHKYSNHVVDLLDWSMQV